MGSPPFFLAAEMLRFLTQTFIGTYLTDGCECEKLSMSGRNPRNPNRLGETLDERADAAAKKCGDRDAKDDDH